MSTELDRFIATIVRTSPDRMLNYIQIGEDRITLEPQPTLMLAKAQCADAFWIVKQLLELGDKVYGGYQQGVGSSEHEE